MCVKFEFTALTLATISFVTDTVWPLQLKNIFTDFRDTHCSLEDHYYGAYDKLLNYCFGPGFDFVIYPQAPPTENARDTDSLYFVVRDPQQRPVFFLAAKDSDDIHRGTASGRTNLRLHVGDVLEEATPLYVYTDPVHVVGRDHLKNEWDLDILSDEGFFEIRRLVTFAMQQYAALQD
ncbi:hypothetical protein B0H10DRAFT_2427126 [Mycena sp. CBHHK59/15]|nr:hypothetical protein B0H10DRAFT_2427126 [Mycena sp. CBHHK59/15]